MMGRAKCLSGNEHEAVGGTGSPALDSPGSQAQAYPNIQGWTSAARSWLKGEIHVRYFVATVHLKCDEMGLK